MVDFCKFAILFFRGPSRIAGLLTLVWAGATLMKWIEELYDPNSMKDIDHFLIGCSIVAMAACSVVFLFTKPEPRQNVG